MENQLTILSESLDKKLEVLQKIREYNKRQEEIFSAEEVDMSLFDDAVEEKQRLIDEVVHLDEGFGPFRAVREKVCVSAFEVDVDLRHRTGLLFQQAHENSARDEL